MKSHLRYLIVFVYLLCLVASSCSVDGQKAISTATDTVLTALSPDATVIVPLTNESLQSSPTVSLTPIPLVLPEVTFSATQSEAMLLELLKSNGNCTGKCIAGIRPDHMTMQEAINTMAQWGMIRVSENSQGRTFVNLVENPLYEQVFVALSVGTWENELQSIDRVSISVAGPPGEQFLDEDIWIENQDIWIGFRLDTILQAYGIPSYVGFFFQTIVGPGDPLVGRTISYNMEIQYEATNMVILLGALSYYDGENLFLCPSKDPHSLGIEINPERSLLDLQNFSPVQWQALTETDLKAFYEKFANDTTLDSCIETNLSEIETLQPTFR